jgi:hypothetical protein
MDHRLKPKDHNNAENGLRMGVLAGKRHLGHENRNKSQQKHQYAAHHGQNDRHKRNDGFYGVYFMG